MCVARGELVIRFRRREHMMGGSQMPRARPCEQFRPDSMDPDSPPIALSGLLLFAGGDGAVLSSRPLASKLTGFGWAK